MENVIARKRSDRGNLYHRARFIMEIAAPFDLRSQWLAMTSINPL
jgi:hypothetical protein